MAQAGHIVPSFIMELSQIETVKFRCPGRNLAWSKEVYIYGEKAQESGLVKVILCGLDNRCTLMKFWYLSHISVK